MSIGFVWFSFQGRINRSAYWLLYFLPAVVLSIVTMIIDPIAGTLYETGAGPVGLISSLFSLFLLWPALAAGAKRLHDLGHSGWWQLLYFVPILGALGLFIFLGFFRGTEGANDYGDDPLGDSDWSSEEVAHS